MRYLGPECPKNNTAGREGIAVPSCTHFQQSPWEAGVVFAIRSNPFTRLFVASRAYENLDSVEEMKARLQ